jgi:hypothetical protein
MNDKAAEETISSSHREENMNHDEPKFWPITLLFPCGYFGLAAFYSYYGIYVLGHYEPTKLGQWGSFQISLAFIGFLTLLASLSFWISLARLKTAPQQLSSPRLTLITLSSALLSGAVLLVFDIVKANTSPMLFGFVCVCLCPALIGVSLVKIHRRWFAAPPSTQQ